MNTTTIRLIRVPNNGMNNFTIRLIEEVRKRPMLWDKNNDCYNNRILMNTEWDNMSIILQKDKEFIKHKWRNLRDQFKRELRRVIIPPNGRGPFASYYTGKWIHFERLAYLRNYVCDKNSLLLDFKESTLDDLSDDIKEEIIECDDALCTEQETDIINEEVPDVEQILKDWRHDVIEIDDYKSNEDAWDDSIPKSEVEEFSKSEVNEFSQSAIEELSESEVVEDSKSKEGEVSSSAVRETEKITLKRKAEEFLQTEATTSKRVVYEKISDKDEDEDEHFAKSIVPFMRRLDPIRKLVIRNEIQSILLRELSGNYKDSKTICLCKCNK